MNVSITQVWVLAVAIVATGFALDALDGSPLEQRMDAVRGILSVCVGITVMGFMNRKRAEKHEQTRPYQG